MLPTHPVPCPRCQKALYRAVSLEDAVDAGAAESPKVERDAAGGFYLDCPHCGQRIAMQRVTAGFAAAWKPAAL